MDVICILRGRAASRRGSLSTHIEFTGKTEAETAAALQSLPRDVTDFAGFVGDEIAKIEAVLPVQYWPVLIDA